MEDKNKFIYSHKVPSIDEKREIKNIKDRYTYVKENDKKLQLKKLDNKVCNIPIIVSLSLGIIGTLIFGLGLTCFLEWNQIIIGVICGILGTIIMIITYPIYKKIHNYLKLKYKDKIIKLADEILNEESR